MAATAHWSHVRHVTLEGFQASLIPLRGKHARGRNLIVDRDVAEWLRTDYRNPWTIYTTREGGREFVGGALRPVGKPWGGTNERASLARLIMGAGPGKAVRTRSGDVCDLRRVNLKVTACGVNRPKPTVPLSVFWHGPQNTLVARAA